MSDVRTVNGIAGSDARPCKNGRVNVSLATHPTAKETVWVACFAAPSTPGITGIRKGDRVSLEGYDLGTDAQGQHGLNVRAVLGVFKPRRKAGSEPAKDWKAEDQQQQAPPEQQRFEGT